MKQLLYILIVLVAFTPAANGQAYLIPAPAQSKPVLITGGTAHLGTGEVIENSVIAFEDGKITLVGGPNSLPELDENRYEVVNAVGKHIYPGFIAPNTRLGLEEIGSVRATRDYDDVGRLNPNLRSIIAYNTDSRVTPTVRSNGILLAQVTPSGGLVSGTSSIVQLDAWNWEDAAYNIDEGIHINWPGVYTYSGWWTERRIKRDKDYEINKEKIELLFEQALAYSKKENPAEKNLKFEAMRGLFDGRKKLYVHTNNVSTIVEAAMFGKEYDLNLVIVGGRDAWMVTDFLKENNIPVLLNAPHRLPARMDEAIDQPFKTATMLQDSGVLFGFYMGGYYEVRNLPFQAGHAVGFGLPYEDAVAALTLNTAKIMGIDDRTGSIEKGKDANLFISEGDALDMMTCEVERAFIQGRQIDLNNKQKMLYQKFQTKYDRQKN